MGKIIGIWINCGSSEEADRIGRALMAARLAPGFNRYAPVASAYVWEGEERMAEEFPLLIKTRECLFDRVVDRVRALHDYRVPAILAVEYSAVSPDYADWVHDNTVDP